MHTASGPRCFCPNPQDCDSGCASSPCQHGGSCYPQRQPPYYSCQCAPPFRGSHCELYTAPTSTPPATCLSQYCADKARDGICDDVCNSHACQWDGGTVPSPWRTPGPIAPPRCPAGSTSTTSATSCATRPSACLTTLNARRVARHASKRPGSPELRGSAVTNTPRSLVLLLLTAPVLRPKPPLPSGLAPVALFFLVPSCPITHYPVLSLADRGAETLTAQPLSACLCFLACCCHRFPGEVTFGSVTHCQAASHIICLQHGCKGLYPSLFIPCLSLRLGFPSRFIGKHLLD